VNSYAEENYSFLVFLTSYRNLLTYKKKKKMMRESIGWRTDTFNVVSE
jgi:hypothetical protein